jgi:hypothetical protein
MDPVQPTKNKTGLIVGTASVLVVALIAVGALISGKKDNMASTANVEVPVSEPAPQPTPAGGMEDGVAAPSTAPTKVTSASVYKNGTYTADGAYGSPAGPEHVSVTLTLKGDIVTDAAVTGEATNQASIKYQAKFISGYKEYVIGKNITTIQLDKIAGSSLTPAGFNAAVAKIEAQAQA